MMADQAWLVLLCRGGVLLLLRLVVAGERGICILAVFWGGGVRQ